ncbi:hypothetical protein ACP70R_043776 [Stipagrostis hirtigluma subsp. patula]
MKGAVLVAVVAAIGNLLQGVLNATIAKAMLYIKREFHLETQPTLEGLFGRRPMLIASSLFYFASGLMMLWSPNVFILLLARLVDGFGVGLAVAMVPVYIFNRPRRDDGPSVHLGDSPAEDP